MVVVVDVKPSFFFFLWGGAYLLPTVRRRRRREEGFFFYVYITLLKNSFWESGLSPLHPPLYNSIKLSFASMLFTFLPYSLLYTLPTNPPSYHLLSLYFLLFCPRAPRGQTTHYVRTGWMRGWQKGIGVDRKRGSSSNHHGHPIRGVGRKRERRNIHVCIHV